MVGCACVAAAAAVMVVVVVVVVCVYVCVWGYLGSLTSSTQGLWPSKMFFCFAGFLAKVLTAFLLAGGCALE